MHNRISPSEEGTHVATSTSLVPLRLVCPGRLRRVSHVADRPSRGPAGVPGPAGALGLRRVRAAMAREEETMILRIDAAPTRLCTACAHAKQAHAHDAPCTVCGSCLEFREPDDSVLACV